VGKIVKYSIADIVDKIQEAIAKGERLYSKPFINYKGATTNGEKYTEVIAEYLLKNRNAVNSGIKQITRESSYRVEGHDGMAIRNSTNRLEERIAHKMHNNEYPNIGNVVDYQVPLKNKLTDTGLGKIDMLSYDPSSDTLFIIELKRPDSKDTLLRCVLEAYTYYLTVNEEKLKSDFCKYTATVVPLVLVFEGSLASREYLEKTSSVKKLMDELDVRFNLLEGNIAEKLL